MLGIPEVGMPRGQGRLPSPGKGAVSSGCHLLAKSSRWELGRVSHRAPAWVFRDAHEGYGPVQGEATHSGAGPQGDRVSPTRCPQPQTPPGMRHLQLCSIVF